MTEDAAQDGTQDGTQDELDELVARLTARAHDPARAVDEGRSRANAPASEPQVAEAEARLKVALPSLLRRCYLQVGDGGWGPGGGLPPLADLVKGFQARRQDNGGRAWPPALLPVCEWGGGIASCLDCASPAPRVIRVDPNMPKADESARLPAALHYEKSGQVKEACWVENASLSAWLGAWADGQPLFYLAYRGGEESDEEDEDEEGEDGE